MNKKTIIGPLVLVGLILFCAFQSSFLDGLKILGEIVNIFGTVFVWVFKLIFSIPQVAEEVLKRIVTTLLVWGLCTWWSVDDFEDSVELKIVNIIAKGIVAILFTILSWVGMF
jgi:hypothetical protein